MSNIVENVKQTIGNFYNIPYWNTNMNSKEVDYMLENYSDLVICNGLVRKIQIDKIIENNFNVYTIKI